jgi:hypothetical protein
LGSAAQLVIAGFSYVFADRPMETPHYLKRVLFSRVRLPFHAGRGQGLLRWNERKHHWIPWLNGYQDLIKTVFPAACKTPSAFRTVFTGPAAIDQQTTKPDISLTTDSGPLIINDDRSLTICPVSFKLRFIASKPEEIL